MSEPGWLGAHGVQKTAINTPNWERVSYIRETISNYIGVVVFVGVLTKVPECRQMGNI